VQIRTNALSPARVRQTHLARPPCTLGITDGSERGDYVPQAHLLRQIGRPHHLVNLMFQYYPDLEGWPTQGVKWNGFFRNNELNKGDGYFPLVLEEGGPWGQLYLRQIQDVRAHGQEPQLTLTMHTDTPDDVLIRIAQSLVPFAPMRIRINHECNGEWFHFNQRWTYKQVNDFFIHFHGILHKHAPGVRTVACWNGPGDHPPAAAYDGNGMGGQLTDEQLAPMFRIADLVSFDQYASLHYGWPDPQFDRANPTKFFKVPVDAWWRILLEFHDQICQVRGGETNVEIHEINEDANLVGDEEQARWTAQFYAEVLSRRLPWLTNITFYQFRDRGGLGLEREDVEKPEVFQELPALAAYRAAIANEHFAYRVQPGIELSNLSPLTMEWRSSTDARGCECAFDVPPRWSRVRVELPPDLHLLAEIGGQWFVKPCGESQIEVMAPQPETPLAVRLFAPPADGRNNRRGSFVAKLTALPALSPA